MDAQIGRIIQKLVGNNVENRDQAIELYPFLPVSIFVPSLGNCEHSISAPHSHPGYSFIILIDALDEIIIDGEHKKAEEHYDLCICAISPHVMHQEIEKEGVNKYIAIFIEPEYFETAIKAHGLSIVSYEGLFIPGSTEVLHLANLFIDIYVKESPVKNTLLKNTASLLTHEIIGLIHSKRIQVASGKCEDPRIEKVIHFLQNNYHTEVSLDTLSQMVNLSVSQFTKIFRNHTGQSPKKYLLELRLQQARIRLRKGVQSISEISFACGFSQPGFFASCFKRRFGVLPGKYQNSFKK